MRTFASSLLSRGIPRSAHSRVALGEEAGSASRASPAEPTDPRPELRFGCDQPRMSCDNQPLPLTPNA